MLLAVQFKTGGLTLGTLPQMICTLMHKNLITQDVYHPVKSRDHPSQQTKLGHWFKVREKSALILFHNNIMLSFFRIYQLASERKQKTNVV